MKVNVVKWSPLIKNTNFSFDLIKIVEIETLKDCESGSIIDTNDYILEDDNDYYCTRAFHHSLIEILEVDGGEFSNPHFDKDRFLTGVNNRFFHVSNRPSQYIAREILASLSSLYDLKDYEIDAITSLLEPKELVTNPESEYGYTDCPSCGVGYHYDNAKFCWNCGQPIEND